MPFPLATDHAALEQAVLTWDEKQAKEFKDILNTYISNVLPYFEIIR